MSHQVHSYLARKPTTKCPMLFPARKLPFRHFRIEWDGKSARLDYVGNPGCHIQLPWQEMVVFRARTNGDDFEKVYDYHIMSKSYETWRKFGSIVHVLGRSSMHKCVGIYIYISIARIPILGWMTIYHIPCFHRGTDGEWGKTYWSNTHERCWCLVDCVDSWHLSWSLSQNLALDGMYLRFTRQLICTWHCPVPVPREACDLSYLMNGIAANVGCWLISG